MRPEFHFTAASGWINDPHGIGFRDGRYDAYYQYVPGGTEWRPDCHWGHATGQDLLSLSEQPVALAPGDGDDGIWTGSLVRDANDRDRIFYTAVSEPDIARGRVRVAASTDDRRGWSKGAVVATAPADLDVHAFRDPYVIAEPDGSWRMLVGAALGDGSAAALGYHSHDLTEWRYEGVTLQRSGREQHPVWTGDLWECPQVVALGDRHLMIFSVWSADVLHYAAYAVGRYADGRFDAETWGRLTFGPSYYAPSLFTDSSGRPGLLFWMRGVGGPGAGWAGALSIPYLLGLDRGRPTLSPHPDVDAYRRDVADDGVVDGLAADATWTPGRSLDVRHGAVITARLTVDSGSLTVQVGRTSWRMPYVGGAVRLLLDGPILEVSSRCGIIGGPIPAAGPSVHLVSDSLVEMRALSRPRRP